MFWKFGFQHASAIDSLLDREDVSLELILDEDDLLQECKSQNTRLIDYFQRVDVLSRLLEYVSGRVEGEERDRFKYPYVAAEVLCSEIWSIVETCVNESERLLLPFWNAILDTDPGDMSSKISLATHFVKITVVFLQKKPEEMFAFIQSIPNVIERMLAHIESPPFVDLIFRLLQLDEQPGNLGVVQWASDQKLIPHLIALLSPSNSSDIHHIVADVLKGIISLSSPSANSLSVGPSSMSMMGSDSTGSLPTSNKLARELAHRDNVNTLVRFMLLDTEVAVPIAESPPAEPLADDDPNSPTARTISSLVNIIPVFIELIRKNNSDFFEPYLFHTLRNRLIQIRQQQQYSQRQMSEEEQREELERAMEEIVDHMGMVHLGGFLEIMSEKLDDFQRLLAKPRSPIDPAASTTGPVIPLTFERFRICELYAEILHCSNMALLNRSPDAGPTYDDQGRLTGGLSGLEELAKLVSAANESGGGSPNSEEEDPGYSASEHVDRPKSADASSIGSGSTGGVDVEDILEEVHFDDDDPIPPEPIQQVGADLPSDASSKEVTSTDVPSPTSTSASRKAPPALIITEPNAATQDDTSAPSPSSDKTVMKLKKGKQTESSPSGETIGDRLKKRFLDLGVIPRLLDLFFEFPLNNFLHNVVYDLLHQILTGKVEKGLNRDLIVSLFQRAKILERIIDGQRRNDEACSKPKGYRAGYMGHLTLISEDIVSAFDHCPPDLLEILSQYAPQKEWDHYVTGKYKETRDKDTSQLGGGRPVMGLGLAGFPSSAASRRIDEGDDQPSGEASSSSHGRTVEVEQDDGGGNGAFASYLAQQINPVEPFSSSSSDNSSDEDDDGAWLDTANRNFHFDESGDFDLSAAPPPNFARAQQQTGGGFDDAFNPSSITVSDPFGADSDEEEESAWGPFADSNATRDATDSVSSSLTISSAGSGDFDDSFGDDFGDFQTATLTEGSAAEEGAGERTPTPGGRFNFSDDFGANRRQPSGDDRSPSPTGYLHGTENGAPLTRQPLPSRFIESDP